MTKFCFAIAAVSATMFGTAFGQESAPQAGANKETIKATFLIAGLHCPPCTARIESSLKVVKGIVAVKVDYKTKAASIEYDESLLTAQEIARRIAATPHVMGNSMHYAAWLALKAPAVKDEASGRVAEKALVAVKGVKSAKAYPEQHVVAAYFEDKGDVTTQQLIDSLKQSGLEAETY